MTKVRWGVLGCAGFAQNCTIPAMLESPSVDLVGVASRSPDKAQAFQAQFGLPRAYGSYQEMLNDPQIEAVYIPLPNGLHGEWLIRAAEKGKHSLSEKPFTSNAEEAQQVADTVARTGVKVMEGFMWRFHPQHDRALQRIQDGVIGPVRRIRAAFTFPIARQPNVRLDPSLDGGSVMDVGCYCICGARYYFQAEPTRVYAQGTFDPEYGVDMSMAGVLTYPQGDALLDCGFHLPGRTEIEIAGEKGTIRIPAPWLPGEEATILVNGQPETLPPAKQYVNEFEHFSQCILNDTPPRYGSEDAVKQMRVVDAVLRSMRSGRPEAV